MTVLKKTTKTRVDDAMGRATTYTEAQARELHGRPGAQVIDSRDVRELEQESAASGDFHAPPGGQPDPADGPDRRPEPEQDTEFVLFGALGWQSAQATQELMDKGVGHEAKPHKPTA